MAVMFSTKEQAAAAARRAKAMGMDREEFLPVDQRKEDAMDAICFPYILVDIDTDMVIDYKEEETDLLEPAREYMEKYKGSQLCIYTRSALLS